MASYRRLTQAFGAALLVLACVFAAQAQVTTGNVRGIVTDPNGAVVPNAKVTITDTKTNNSQTTQSSSEGEYEFKNLLAGDYTITVEAANFKPLTLTDVHVSLNQTTDVPTTLTVGQLQGETVTVSAGGAELVQTTTTTLSKGFTERQAVELAQTTAGVAGGGQGGIYNLALIAPNVSSSGGVGVGAGGSVGGQRPRNNNFTVDGIDNNRKDVTGPAIYVSPETISEFSLLSNQYSAEFGRSTGGQFIVATKSGTNDFHGTVYEFLQNRHLNALDTLQKNAGVVRDTSAGDLANPRFDYNRFGGNIGGPIYFPHFGEGGPTVYSGKNKLFFFFSYERQQLGQAASPGGLVAPTAAGFATINSLPGLSARNVSIFNTYVPRAPVQGTTATGAPRFITVAGTPIPVGPIAFAAPNFANEDNYVINIDYTQSSKTQHRGRFIYDNLRSIDFAANLPAFFTNVPTDGRLFSYSLFHNFTPSVSNEMRLSYRRYSNTTPVPNIGFPGLDAFPNIQLDDLAALQIGPDPNAPQFSIENNYQIIDNLSYTRGNHSFKFGGDFRKSISPQSFVQRQRGDYEYGTTDLFLRDITPDQFGERTVGSSAYYGDQKILFAFAQDDWRFRPNLTFNLGLSYSYQQLPFGARQQVQNSIASVPGLIEFREPRAQKKNFAPRVGFAYSPSYESGWKNLLFGNGNKSSLRVGFSMAYDVIFDNLYILSLPPQSNQTRDLTQAQLRGGAPNFLANGGISSTPNPIGNNAAAARSATSGFIPDQQVPYAITWTGSYQRQFLNDWALELRYVGTRGIHLLTQNRLNVRSIVTPQRFLPTFLARPSQAQLDALPTTLDDLLNISPLVPAYENAGFSDNFLVGFLSNGNSTYHGGSAQLTRRFTRGFQLSGAYTWSHLIDDTTAEVFSTVLSPRRVEDFQNLRKERADSALDRRHRFVLSSIYDLPWFTHSKNAVTRLALGGLSFAGTLTFESGEKATVRSGVDSNLNLDNAGDRSITNVGGVEGTSSTVTALTNSAGDVVGYLANNPNAQYIQAGLGALSNTARNTLQLPGINNLDFSIFKNFWISENKRFQIRADLFNAFNHPQYVPGSINSVTPIATTGVTDINTVGRTFFNVPDQVFSSHPRNIQLAVRFNF
ncbi:MAG TPA: carboxypeptidase regulatory-like domain-containing protein [Pyrinomonadaceae bacterium]|jgi:hypothetical protein